jgi:hypothetical protein
VGWRFNGDGRRPTGQRQRPAPNSIAARDREQQPDHRQYQEVDPSASLKNRKHAHFGNRAHGIHGRAPSPGLCIVPQ